MVTVECYIWEDSTGRLPECIKLSPAANGLRIMDGESRASLHSGVDILKTYKWADITSYTSSPSEDPTDMDKIAFTTSTDTIKIEIDDHTPITAAFDANGVGQGGDGGVQKPAPPADLLSQIQAGTQLKAVGPPTENARGDILSQIRGGVTLKGVSEGVAGNSATQTPPAASADFLSQIKAGAAAHKGLGSGDGSSNDGDKLKKYAMMQKMKLPEGAIRQKMTQDGLSDADQAEFFAGGGAAGGGNAGGGDSGGRAAEMAAPAGLLSQIQAGVSLKKVE
jgi:hypothetical protein